MSTRRAVIGGAGAAVLAALGYRAWDRGAFTGGEGEAFGPWRDWQGAAGEGIRRPLHAAILAANPHDTQPWLFAAKDDLITVFAARARNLGAFDPYRREMYLGLGCALTNLELAAYRLGFFSSTEVSKGALTLSPADTPVEVAHVRLSRKSTLTDEVVVSGMPTLFDLAKAIPRRHTNRGPYRADQPVPANFLDGCSKRVTSTQVRIVFITGDRERAAMRDVIVKATEACIADPQMSADSARWFRTGRREIEEHRDGVTTDTAGLSPLMTIGAKLLPDQGGNSAGQYWLSMTRETQAATAPVFGMIMVRDRLDIAQTLAAGRTWQLLHLAATAEGLAAQPMNQPVEMVDRNQMLKRPDDFKPALMALAGMPGWEPTFTFRMGYAVRDASPSPRRPLAAVMRA